MPPQRRALIVEDDPDIRALLRKHLERLGMQVTECADGRAAVQTAPKLMPDFICLDLMLPNTSGYEVCEAIRRTPGLERVPVLVVSARSMPSDRAFAEESGASGYLMKPFTWKQFSEQVEALLGKS